MLTFEPNALPCPIEIQIGGPGETEEEPLVGLFRALVRTRPLGLKNDVLYWYLVDREPPADGFVTGELLIELPTVWSSDLHIVAFSDAVLDLPSHSYFLAIKVHIPNLSRWDVVRTWVHLTQGSHPMRHFNFAPL